MKSYLCILILALCSFGCSKPTKDNNRSANSDATEGLESADAKKNDEHKSNEEPSDSSFALGLPAFCKLESDQGETRCLSCKPRELSIYACNKSSELADANQQCSFNNSVIRCGGLEFGYTLRTQVEQFYEKIPTLLLGLSLFVQQHPEVTAEQKQIFSDALALFKKHKANIFSGQNKEAVQNDIVALVKKSDPSFDETKVSAASGKFSEIWDSFTAKVRTNEITLKDAISIMFAYISSMPDADALLGDGFDLEKISQILSADSTDGLEELLGGIEGLDSLLNLFQTP